MKTEEDFPRDSAGSGEKTTKKGRKRPAEQDEESTIVTIAKKIKLAHKINPKTDSRLKALNFHVEKNLIILGCVSEVKDYEVIVTLTDGLKGKLSFTNICDAYTEKLEQLASGNLTINGGDPKLLSLHDILYPGSVVRCCIIEIEQSIKKKLTLSISPKDVNRDLVELKNGMTVTGVISSCEDHGYMVDVGISGVSAFLAKSETTEFISKNKDKFPDNVELSVGSYVTCMVREQKSKKKSGNRAVTLTINPDKLATVAQGKMSLQTLLPGTLVQCTVQSSEESAIFVEFGSINGIIFNNHLEKNVTNYEEGQEIVATVLYVQPSTKVAVLSQLKHLFNPMMYKNLFESLDVGDIIYDVKVVKVHSKLGIYVKTTDGLKGFVKKVHVNDKKVEDLKQFKKDQTYQCRVVGFDYLNRLVMFTMKESLLKMAHFNYQDIKLGQILDCTIKKVNRVGLRVSVTGRISGFVSYLHFSDILLTNPGTKFKVGKIIKCRVLEVKPEKSKLILTHKRSLLKPKHSLPYDFEHIQGNSIITGFVVLVKPQGVLVAFGNNVKGWVPKKELSYETIDDPEKKFYMGQVVDCRVKFCNPDEKKLILSLKVRPEKLEKEEVKVEEIGMEVEASIEEDERNDEVSNKNNNMVAVLNENSKKEMKNKKPKTLELPIEGMFKWEDEEDDKSKNVDADKEKGNQSEAKLLRSNIAKKVKDPVKEKRFNLEKVTLLEPNDSQNWINLIGFELEEEGIDKARGVAEKAVKSISFREDEQKLNVHMCRLNLEHTYGTKESLQEYINLCMGCCDQLKVLNHIRELYVSAGSTDEAVDVCKLMIKKFKDDPEVWVPYGIVLYKAGRLEQARHLLRDSLNRLDTRHHIFLTTKFALLESEYGVADIADTLFEKILTNFPKRTDIWSIYTDRCISLERTDQARNILKRAINIEPKLPVKKAAFLLKKYIAFEEKYGSSLIVDELKSKLSKLTTNEN